MANTEQAIPLSKWHWILEDYRQRVTFKQARYILLTRHTMVFRGDLYDVKVKTIGAGVYEIYKVPHQTLDI